jgi:glucose/arabinose dehydrogenase
MEHVALRRMRRTLITIALVFACSNETPAPAIAATAGDPVLQHHVIKLEDLPKPYASSSAGNAPRVVAQPPGAALHVPPGFSIAVYAANLENPRTMLLAPNGDVIVAETGAGRISILRDANHDGVAESKFVFASELNEPFGLALHDKWLYVGNQDSIVRFPYTAGQTRATQAAQRLASLPPGGHSTRGIIFNRTGTKMYVSIGSASNVSAGEPPERAAIVEFNPDGTGKRIFASGLRNPVGMAWQPETGSLWTVVNERDGLGDDLVPDYATEVRDGAFYGWPYTWLGNHEDPRRKGERPDLVAKAIVPSVLIQAHSAALGIAFYTGTMFPAEYRGSAFVALHGSWNRAQRTGYKIIRIPFHNGKATGGYDDFVAGWMTDPDARSVWGRPVGLLQLGDGSLLISDDGGEKIWRVTYKK